MHEISRPVRGRRRARSPPALARGRRRAEPRGHAAGQVGAFGTHSSPRTGSRLRAGSRGRSRERPTTAATEGASTASPTSRSRSSGRRTSPSSSGARSAASGATSGTRAATSARPPSRCRCSGPGTFGARRASAPSGATRPEPLLRAFPQVARWAVKMWIIENFANCEFCLSGGLERPLAPP